MARKAKAKRPGRPELPQEDRRKVYSVRLPRDLAERATALAMDRKLTTAVEYALKLWLDEHSPSNQGAKHE